MTKFKVTDQKFLMDDFLLSNLNSLAYNAVKDWDFVLPITGSGKTRVGKSVLGMQVAYYLASKLGTKFDNYNVVFSGQDLMNKALESPKNTVFVYDESRGELEGKKAIQKVHSNLYDFFAECGMLNHIIILIMPDFFELQKGIAVNRSLFLLNVKYGRSIKQKDGVKYVSFDRGKFEYYDERKKRMLYFMGKKNYNDYSVVKGNFSGEFPEHWTIDKDIYEKNKIEFMRRNKEETSPEKTDKKEMVRNALIHYLATDLKYKFIEISTIIKAKGVEFSRQSIGAIMKDYISPPSVENKPGPGLLTINPPLEEETNPNQLAKPPEL